MIPVCIGNADSNNKNAVLKLRAASYLSLSRLVFRVVDPEWFVSDPTPDPTFKEVSAPTPHPDPVSDPATLVSDSTEFHICR